ncbi:MAG: hypothetical protein CME65_00630 [Halobacteriovoraceae bacterium]|nr:hypothetical protein [Halobacteriovoraceae bacterium]|tara:strand:+ start:11268 stop:12014 length:747 start_codon:yes stop_codon:yes gene_type:complete
MTKTPLLKAFVLLTVLVSFVSCGSQAPMVKNVKVSTSQQDNDVLVSLSADLSIGNVQLPFTSLPIILPKVGKQIGQLTLQSSADGANQLVLDVNVSEAANLELASVQLPNGSMLPIIGDNSVLVIPAGKVQIYLSLLDGAQAIGVAVPIKTFDAIGSKVGTTALMPIFNNNNILGAAGVYTSAEAGKNGFALVADLSGVINVSIPNIFARQAQSSLDYSSPEPSRRQERKINSMLYRMHKKKQMLELN